VERLRAVARRRSLTPASIAIAWTLRDSAVTAAIVGARKSEQVDAVVAAAQVRLTQSDLTRIEPVADLAQLAERNA
jgi:aryl-alcohol dehydrogenase-like predicted oxidoreductase